MNARDCFGFWTPARSRSGEAGGFEFRICLGPPSPSRDRYGIGKRDMFVASSFRCNNMEAEAIVISPCISGLGQGFGA